MTDWARFHIVGMGLSYIRLLTAFIDNGKSLPLWRDLPSITYWLLPSLAGVRPILHALRWPPVARQVPCPKTEVAIQQMDRGEAGVLASTYVGLQWVTNGHFSHDGAN